MLRKGVMHTSGPFHYQERTTGTVIQGPGFEIHENKPGIIDLGSNSEVFYRYLFCDVPGTSSAWTSQPPEPFSWEKWA